MKYSAIRQCERLLSVQEQQAIDAIIAALPHGSGIDCDWRADVLENGNVRLANSYHGMHDSGMYDGWQDFSIVLFCHQQEQRHALRGPCAGQYQITHRAGDVDFRLHFNGYRQQKSWACGLRDYLEESIGYALSELGIGVLGTDTVSA